MIQELVGPVDIKPSWKRIIIKSKLPEKLHKLAEIIQNLWWTWDDEAQELFEVIDPEIWQKCEQNPAILFEQVKYGQLVEISQNTEYTDKLDRVYARFENYISLPKNPDFPRIAYFSMEYGFHTSMKIYSGGLGILAGDYLKEASDQNTVLSGWDYYTATAILAR